MFFEVLFLLSTLVDYRNVMTTKKGKGEAGRDGEEGDGVAEIERRPY